MKLAENDHSSPVPLGDRSVPLDGIRGIAILLAVMYHVWQDVPALTQLDRAIEAATSFFWTGVDLFFVLSGFFITRILYNTRESPDYFRSFYARRMLRTWPLYYFALALVLGIPALFSHSLVESSPWWFVFHGSNYLTAFYSYPRRVVVHFWSLAIEEQFYLVWPLIRFLKSRERMMTLCAALIVFAIALRAVLIYFLHADSRLIYALTFTRLDSLAAGGLLGLWLVVPGDPARRRLFLASLAAICIAVLTMGLTFEGGAIKYWSAFSQTLNYTAVAGVCACLIGWSRTSQPDAWLNRGLCWRPLPFLGKYSYSIYMFHIWFDAVGRGTKMHPATNPAWRLWGSTLPMIAYFLTILAVVCIWALITWNLIERRFLALKDRFGYRAASARR